MLPGSSEAQSEHGAGGDNSGGGSSAREDFAAAMVLVSDDVEGLQENNSSEASMATEHPNSAYFVAVHEEDHSTPRSQKGRQKLRSPPA